MQHHQGWPHGSAAASTSSYPPSSSYPSGHAAPSYPAPSAQYGTLVAPPKTPWQLAQEAHLKEQSTEEAPKPQARMPLYSSTKMQYGRKLLKYTFQSDQRDLTLYPSPSYYRIQLELPLRNVIGIHMDQAVVPISEPNVNPYNQWIDIDVGGTLYQVQVPEGEYSDGFSLAAGVEAAIQAVGGPLAAFTVTYTFLTRKLTVNSNGPACILKWRTGPNVNRSMWVVMGFPREDTANTPVHVAPGIIDLAGALAIDVFIDEIETHINSVDNQFVRISLQKFTPASTVTYFTPTTAGLPVTFWPIARLQYLTFRFLVKYTALLPDGQVVVRYRPYDFQGRNHTFMVAVQTREYRNIMEDFVELDPQS